MEEEISFPRGGTERYQSDKLVSEDEPKSSTKAKKSSSSKSRKRSTSQDDFLFGSSSGADSTAKKKKRKKSSSDATATASSDVLASSALPIGGGGVIPPSSKSSSSSVQHKSALIESLSFQKLRKGTKLLGIIREVTPEYAIVSLPSMLTAFLKHKAGGGGLNRVVRVGMVLPVVVLSATSETITTKDTTNGKKKPIVKRRIEVSISPSLVNHGLTMESLYEGLLVRGRILSVEDHGCLVDLHVNGVKSKSCFLKFENIEGGYTILPENDEDSDDDDDEVMEEGEKFPLNKGRIYDFTILTIPSSKQKTSTSNILQLKLESQTSRSQRKTESASIISKKSSEDDGGGTLTQHTIRTLSPGMLCEAYVEHFAKNGLCVSFLGNVFRGSIEVGHLGAHRLDDVEQKKISKGSSTGSGEMWWKDVFVGKLRTITARIIAVDPVAKILRLSLLPHILSLSAPSTLTSSSSASASMALPPVGTIVENARVVRLDTGIGALLAMSSLLQKDTTEEEEDDDDEDMEDEEKSSSKKSKDFTSNPIYQKTSQIPCAYVHISKAVDNTSTKSSNNQKTRTPEIQFNKKFAVNTIVPKLRILSTTNWIENIASCSTADNIVSSAVLTYTDLRPGEIYKSVPIIANLEKGGVLVELGGLGVKGIVPPMHLFDNSSSLGNGGDEKNNHFRNKIKKEKFKVGNKMDVRCLMVDSEEKKCILTAKKSLLQSNLEDAIVDYSKVKSGQIVTGFISRVTKKGLTITFYNNIFGRVSARKLAEELGVEDPTMDYKIGDVVKVRVEGCVQRKKRNDEGDDEEAVYHLHLSLDLLASTDESKSGQSLDGENMDLKVGSILPPKCMKILEIIPSREKNSDDESFTPGHAVVSIKSKDLASDNGKKTKGSIHCKLPFEHLLDSFETDVTKSAKSVDSLAYQVLKVGKKIAQESLILHVPNGRGLPTLTLKSHLIESAKLSLSKDSEKESSPEVSIPSSSTSLFMGAYVHGYCARIDSRYGSFIRFFGNLTGLIPKLKGGLNIPLYDTVLCKVIALDITSGTAPKILLKQVKSKRKDSSKKSSSKGASNKKLIADSVKIGENLGDVKVVDINFARATVTLLDKKFADARVKARIHMTMADPGKKYSGMMPLKEEHSVSASDEKKITKFHPFHSWEIGSIVKNTRCVAIDVKEGMTYLELSNRDDSSTQDDPPALFVEGPSHLKAGDTVCGVITSVSNRNKGIWLQICPGVTGFIPGLELTDDIDVLNEMGKFYKIGGKIRCAVINNKAESGQFKKVVRLSVLALSSENKKKPTRGDLRIGRINRTLKQQRAPSLTLELRGGYLGRCDITELDEVDDWSNMPLGRDDPEVKKRLLESEEKEETKMSSDETQNEKSPVDGNDSEWEQNAEGDYSHGTYVQCRVLTSSASGLEVSMRESRIEGDLEDDEVPAEKDIVHAYVVTTNRKGCFLRLSRFVEGRVILKELSDSFLPDPVTMFPPGRLVVGKVKSVKNPKGNGFKARKIVDLDMKESSVLEDQNKVKFEDMEEGQKHRGVVTRIESYGVFVRLENSDVSGLVHLSQCSDDYIKNLSSLFDPGDLVKVLVIKVQKDEKQIGFSMKASHFEDDSDSDDESIDDDSDSDVQMKDADDVDSDDEDFASKLAANMKDEDVETSSSTKPDKGSTSDSSSVASSSDSDSDSDDSSDSDSEDEGPQAMDTNVGFDWGNDQESKGKKILPDDDSDSDSSSDESDDSDDDDDGGNKKSNHKSRKKAAERRKVEQKISQMEERIADGTADENPETTLDFERLLASDPNSSEIWMKFMAYHLSLADIESARNVANRAFERIEFREENEKLNVWTALLALEHKFGTTKTFNETIDRASQQNNPKQVYLRVCEMLEREVDSPQASAAVKERADEMFAKMCKKHRSKKTCWVAYFKYLVKSARHDEAHDMRKRSLASLPSYKHIDTMSKYAQLEYEFGSAERARTIFDAILDKYPKRMDLLFVYVDKEIKHGEVTAARRLFEKIVNPPSGGKKVKYSDKQMKSMFKKWYRMEDAHGDDESRTNVKNAARSYVERSSKQSD